MLLTRLLNACHHFPGFVYAGARLVEARKTIEIEVRPRAGSQARCSGCQKQARGYDQLPQRRFEFIPVWGFAVELLYRMRRVQCRSCGVKVEQVPWGAGKYTLTRAYMLHLAHWARKLSEGLNNKAKVTMRKAYGYRTFRMPNSRYFMCLESFPNQNTPTISTDEPNVSSGRYFVLPE